MKNNPYIGPRPFERQHRDRFYGRDREARELQSLIVSEREVLFYAQSGAGKSSLLNARVIPCLEDEGYTVLPVIRVGNELPPGIEPQEVRNIFVFSTLLSLAGPNIDPRMLVSMTLVEWLPDACQAELPILIFDQFEEIFTAYRERWQEAEEFFRQVRQALDTYPNLGIVFTMREDYLASVDTYALYFARRLRARFRMELLGVAGALSAVKQPAQTGGCRFEPGAAERLIDNLRQIKAQGMAQTDETVVLGPYIEPVQLQVVCSQLWDNLPEKAKNDNTIQWVEIEQYGDIDHALTGFYETAVAGAVEQARRADPGTSVNERMVRRWFGEQMITPMDTRGLVMRGPEETASLPNAAVNALERQHIIRADLRAGARWYELAHDRLIGPIQASNKAWEQQQEELHLWRPIARRWQETQSDSLLYRGKELQEARQWLETADPREVDTLERDFILASQSAELARLQEQRKRKVRTVIYALMGAVVALFAIVAASQWFTASQERNRAESLRMTAEESKNQANLSANIAVAESTISAASQATAVVAQKTAEAAEKEAENALLSSELARQDAQLRGLIAQARSYYDHDNPKLASLLEIEALRMKPDPATSQALRAHMGLLASPVAQAKSDGEMAYSMFSADGKWVLSYGCRQYDTSSIQPVCTASFLLVWEAATGKEIARFDQSGTIYGATFNQDHQRMMAWGCEQNDINGDYAICTSGFAVVWQISTGKELTRVKQPGLINNAAFNPNGRWIVISGCNETNIRNGKRVCVFGFTSVRDISIGQEIFHQGQAGFVNASSFSPNGEWVLISLCYQYDYQGAYPICTYSSSTVWDVAARKEMAHMALAGDVSRAVFSPDGQWVLNVWCNQYNNNSKNRVCTAGVALVWRASSGWQAAKITQGGDINSADFSPDGKLVVTVGCEHYDFSVGLPTCPSYKAQVLDWGTGTVIARFTQDEYFDITAFSPNGKTVLSRFEKGFLIWETANGREVTSRKYADRMVQAAFSPDGQRVVTGGCDVYDANRGICTSGSGRLWDATSGDEIARMIQDGPVTSAAFSHDGNWVVSGGCDQFNSAGSYSTCATSSAHVWMPGSSGEIFRTVLPGKVISVDTSPDGQWVLTNSCDQRDCQSGSITIWEASTGKQVIRMKHKWAADSASFSRDGKKIVTTSCLKYNFIGESYTCASSTVILWDAATGDEITRINLNQRAYDARISPDDQWVSSAGCDQFSEKDNTVCTAGSAHVWDISTKTEIAAITQDGIVNSAAFSPDGQWVISSGCLGQTTSAEKCTSGSVRVWEAKTGKEIAAMNYPGYLPSASFSPDGHQVLATAADGTITVWSAGTWKEIARLKSDGAVNGATFSQDGKLIVSGSSDKTARVWNTTDWKEETRANHEDIVSSVAIRPDGNWVVSGSYDGTVRVWPWRTGDLIQMACERLPRNLTQQEWDVTFPGEPYRQTCPNLPEPTK